MTDQPTPVRSTGEEMDRHYLNVGRVAVAATHLEETAASIIYASDGGWDNSDIHLKYMANSTALRESLLAVCRELPGGTLKSRLEGFADAMRGALDARHPIVHSVVRFSLFDGEHQAVHPKAVAMGRPAARPLPSDDEVNQLIERLDDLIRTGLKLAMLVAASFARKQAK